MHALNVGILGATGAVGQKFIRLLQEHPWFKVKALGASERSAGKPYRRSAHWIENIDLPDEVADLVVQECDPKAFEGIDFVFSGLDSSVAGEIEKNFASTGIPVISNAKNYRMDDHVPLLVPEINPDHTGLIDMQSFTDDGIGWIATNPNCVVVPLVMSLKPLQDAFGIESVVVTSMQSVSGAGYPGVSSMDITGNVIPYIGGEESKIRTEPLKLLGRFDRDKITPADFAVEATAVRVATIEGHLLSVSVNLKDKTKNIEQAKEAVNSWTNPIGDLELPSSPNRAIRLYEEERFPQPRLHSDREKGMQTAIGRLRKGHVFDLNYVTMAHNTIRGAAGGAVLNAELLVKKGYL